MGSDSEEKKHNFIDSIKLRLRTIFLSNPRNKKGVLILTTVSTFLILSLLLLKERTSHANHGASRIITEDELNLARKALPERCHSTLSAFHKCQSSSLSDKEIIVLACHRKWCSSYGHCEDSNGIGDRTRHMLSLFTDAMEKCLPVELDYPQERNGVELRFRNSLEYNDPLGMFGEIFHRRSYDVSDRFVAVKDWGSKLEKKNTRTFVHFMPNGYRKHQYDPCLYHILFRLSPQLQTEVDYYSDLFRLNTGQVLGIHFRTGDLTAFGVQNKDIRASGSSLKLSYDKMIECAQNLADDLDLSPVSEKEKKLSFYLATDNEDVKEMARNDSRYNIELTDIKPSAYLTHEGDWGAFLELHLLSKVRGLVVNALPDNYDGPADKLSTFAMLAKNIGFMEDSQLKKCHI